jgi:hypothetical protein
MIHIDEIIWKLFSRSPFFLILVTSRLKIRKIILKTGKIVFSLFLVDTSENPVPV